MEKRWIIEHGMGPLAAVAVHDGHDIRPEVASLLAIGEDDRLREEDPYTAELVKVVENNLIVKCSRFEVDLNRPREKAVYQTPEDAWGLYLWKNEISEEIVERSLEQYDAFYDDAFQFLSEIEHKYGRFVVLDIHSYCHRRNGPDSEPDPLDKNPDINVGTGTMNRQLWANLVDRFIKDFKSYPFCGRTLDVRENIRFRGGKFPKWVHDKFPETGCCLAIEIKKIFMDEWSGKIDHEAFDEVKIALESTLEGLLNELNNMDR